MPIEDVDVPYSDGWWLRRLMKGLNAKPAQLEPKVRDSRRCHYGRREWFDLLWSYNIGEAPLPKLSQSHREATREMLRLARANYGQLVVEAVLDRVQVLGVRTGKDGDADGDDVVRRIHVANGAWLQDTLGFTFSMGIGYAFIGPAAKPGTALITAEDPRNAIAVTDPTNPYLVRAALKAYVDEDEGVERAHLFRPGNPKATDELGRQDRVRVATRKAAVSSAGRFSPQSWTWDEERSGPLEVQGLGVPVVPFPNKLGMGEFEAHLDLLDRINNMIADRLWISKLQAFRQRALRAKEGAAPIPDKDEHGNDINLDELFESDPGALWELPPGYDIWESQQADIQPILLSVRDDVKELASVSRTPSPMLIPDGANQSAAGAESLDDGAIMKANDRIRRLDPAAILTIRMALAYAGETELAAQDLQMIWAPTKRMSLSERAAAGAAAKAAGVPQESVWSEFMQLDPATIGRMRRERGSDLFFQQPGQPPVQPPVTGNG